MDDDKKLLVVGTVVIWALVLVQASHMIYDWGYHNGYEAHSEQVSAMAKHSYGENFNLGFRDIDDESIYYSFKPNKAQ